MKVLLTNGSPHEKGCTYTALCAVSEALNRNGIDTDICSGSKKSLFPAALSVKHAQKTTDF